MGTQLAARGQAAGFVSCQRLHQYPQTDPQMHHSSTHETPCRCEHHRYTTDTVQRHCKHQLGSKLTWVSRGQQCQLHVSSHEGSFAQAGYSGSRVSGQGTGGLQQHCIQAPTHPGSIFRGVACTPCTILPSACSHMAGRSDRHDRTVVSHHNPEDGLSLSTAAQLCRRMQQPCAAVATER